MSTRALAILALGIALILLVIFVIAPALDAHDADAVIRAKFWG